MAEVGEGFPGWRQRIAVPDVIRASRSTIETMRNPAVLRLCLMLSAIAGLSACATGPGDYAAYRDEAIYRDSYRYPGYRGYPYGDPYYRDGYRSAPPPVYNDAPRRGNPFDDAMRLHRDTRRSLGLPRLPGMP